MINKVIVAHLYDPGSAATNRIMAFSKAYALLGLSVILVLGCRSKKTLPIIDNVTVLGVIAKKRLTVASKMAKAIKKHYSCSQQCAIHVYGSPLLCFFLDKRRYNIYYETTEIPFYGRRLGLKTVVREVIKMILAKRATGLFVISKRLKQYYYRRGFFNTVVINMFVDTDRFEIDVSNVREKYVAYCGTVSPYKDGVDCLIKAFAIFIKTHPDYKLMIIGQFENLESERRVRGMADELGVSDRIDFTGMVSPNEMPHLLKEASLLALARPNNRQAQYGFPTKLGEYLATGNPVVVTDVGEIGIFLHDGENCRMATPGNAEDFAEKMAWVADHPEEAKVIGLKGKELTRNEFSALEQSRKALAFMAAIKKSFVPE